MRAIAAAPGRPYREALRRVVAWITGSVFLLLGLIYCVFGGLEIQAAAQSSSWPVVNGTVITSEVVEDHGSPPGFSPRVAYRYVVGDTSYVGTKIWFSDLRTGESPARAAVAEFPVDASVRVHYRASAPGDAVLKPGVQRFNFVTAGMGLVGLTLGAAIHPWWRWRRRRSAFRS